MCVDDVVRLGGGALERVENFILAEGLKIEFFWHYQVEKAAWYKLFVILWQKGPHSSGSAGHHHFYEWSEFRSLQWQRTLPTQT